MRIFRAAVTALAIALTPVIAAAQDMSRWDGFYAGVQASVGDGSMGYAGNPLIYGLEGKSQGFFLGHLWASGPWAYGIEIQSAQTDFWQSDSIGAYRDYTLTTSSDVKARLGYAVGSNLFYGVVGYGLADWQEGSFSFQVHGPLAGLGAERLYGDRFFVGAEVLQRSLEWTGETTILGRTQFDLTTVSVRAGLRF